MTIFQFRYTHFITCLLIFLSPFYDAHAQTIYDVESPYEVSIKRDLPVFLVGGAGVITSIVLESKIDKFTEEDIAALNKDDIRFDFDRKVTSYSSENADVISDIFLGSSYIFPVAFAVDRRTRNGYLQIGVLATEAFLVNGAVTNLTKVFSKRARPYTYNPDYHTPTDKLEVRAQTSFFSGHTSAVSTMSFFCAKVFNDYHPDSKWKPLIWSSAALIPATTGLLRVRAGKHFPTDVITGYIVGGTIGILVPHLHKKKSKEQKVSFMPFSGGDSIGVLMTW